MAMLKFLVGVVGISMLLWSGTPYAHGQKTTEMFIPVGQSPGLSGKVTIIGTIEKVTARNRTIVVSGPSEKWGAKVSKNTHIWLDGSTLRLPTQYGTFEDLRKGQLVEVKYKGTTRKNTGPAEWIKVQVTQSGSQ